MADRVVRYLLCDGVVLTEGLLQEGVNCSQQCTKLMRDESEDAAPSLKPLICSTHPLQNCEIICVQCEAEMCRICASSGHHAGHECLEFAVVTSTENQRLVNAADQVEQLLVEVQGVVSGVKEMKKKVGNRRDDNIKLTKEAFAALRKAIDEREETVLADINEEATMREKALQVQMDYLTLLWMQLKNLLVLTKRASEGGVTGVRLMNRRRLLECRKRHLNELKELERSKMTPMCKEQQKINFKKVNSLCQQVNELGCIPFDPEVAMPSSMLIVNKEASLRLTLKNADNELISLDSININISVVSENDNGDLPVRITREVDSGVHKVSFVPSKCGNHLINILTDDDHIPGSPFRVCVVLRDYTKITQKDCKVVTRYGKNKFGHLFDVAIGPNREVILVDWSHNCVIALDRHLNLLRVIGQGSDESKLDRPAGVAMSGDVIAVSVWSSHQVKLYSLQGEFLSAIGNKGAKQGQFYYPRGLTYNSNGVLLVVDMGNHRVQAFNRDNSHNFSFGGRGSNPGQFQRPVRVAVGPDDLIAVNDYEGNLINLFDDVGGFIKRIECYKPCAVIISPALYLITSHYGDTNKIKVWSPANRLIKEFGKMGSRQGEFNLIDAMTMDAAGNIYVVEWDNSRLQIIS